MEKISLVTVFLTKRMQKRIITVKYLGCEREVEWKGKLNKTNPNVNVNSLTVYPHYEK